MSTADAQARPLRAWHLLVWLVAAIASTMCGIGGGLFAVPILHFLLKLPLKLATATSLVSVFAMTLAGTLAELAQPQSALNWPVIACLSAGGLFGAWIGQFVARRLGVRALSWIFAIALSAAGIRILVGGAATAGFPSVAPSLDMPHAFGVAALGVAAGFVSPLLGVGGGLIMVPGLVLGLPGLGYLGARACSTAMSVVSSAQLTWMNLRDGRVHRAVLLPFCSVSVLGAVLGIALVHRPGWAEVARRLMGALLVIFGAKFAWRALR